jgi:hypothetical protein
VSVPPIRTSSPCECTFRRPRTWSQWFNSAVRGKRLRGGGRTVLQIISAIVSPASKDTYLLHLRRIAPRAALPLPLSVRILRAPYPSGEGTLQVSRLGDCEGCCGWLGGSRLHCALTLPRRLGESTWKRRPTWASLCCPCRIDPYDRYTINYR